MLLITGYIKFDICQLLTPVAEQSLLSAYILSPLTLLSIRGAWQSKPWRSLMRH